LTPVEDVQVFLAGARIDPSVWEMRPDYRVGLVAAYGIEPGPSDDISDEWLNAAEVAAQAYIGDAPVEELAEVAAWREAYRSFGAKPQRTRNSLEALLRRIDSGLPRINKLTDLYNSISVTHRIPLGGEDLYAYQGAPHLTRATGSETFDTMDKGEPVLETPDIGEVIWRDEVGVTCRRWNWRQCHRTRLLESSTSALFILDALDPVTDSALCAAVDDVESKLQMLGSTVQVSRRLIGCD
jgi:DNA/RNA-binding domain of Phe-tRNA-synthetase-like protein